MRARSYVAARVTHRFGASPERVFDAWLDAEMVATWWRLFASAAGRGASETLENVRIDARVGGSFSVLVRRDGRLIDHTGEYLEITRPRRLVFTWAPLTLPEEPGARAAAMQEGSPAYSRVIIEIAPLSSGCEVTLVHEMHPDWSEFVDRAANAWKTMLDAIDEVLTT